jgi:hypothetical protein
MLISAQVVQLGIRIAKYTWTPLHTDQRSEELCSASTPSHIVSAAILSSSLFDAHSRTSAMTNSKFWLECEQSPVLNATLALPG